MQLSNDLKKRISKELAKCDQPKVFWFMFSEKWPPLLLDLFLTLDSHY